MRRRARAAGPTKFQVRPAAHSAAPQPLTLSACLDVVHETEPRCVAYAGKLTLQCFAPECSVCTYLGAGLAGYVDDGRLFVIGRVVDMLFAVETSMHAADLEATLMSAAPSLRHGGCALALPPPTQQRAALDVATGGLLTHAPEQAHLRISDSLDVAKKREDGGAGGRRQRSWRQLSRRVSATANGWLSAIRSDTSIGSPAVPGARALGGGPQLDLPTSLPDLQTQQKGEESAQEAATAAAALASGGARKAQTSFTRAILMVRQARTASKTSEGRSGKRQGRKHALLSCFRADAESEGAAPINFADVAQSLAVLKLVRTYSDSANKPRRLCPMSAAASC